MQKKVMLLMAMSIQISMPIISSQEQMGKLTSDVLFIYKRMIEDSVSEKDKKELYDLCIEGKSFFDEFLSQIEKNGLPDYLKDGIEDFDNPMMSVNPYKNAYGFLTYKVNNVIKNMRTSGQESLFSSVVLPLQKEYILDSYNKLLRCAIDSPDSNFLPCMHDLYKEFKIFYQEHIKERATTTHAAVAPQKQTQISFFAKWSRWLRFLILPAM